MNIKPENIQHNKDYVGHQLKDNIYRFRNEYILKSKLRLLLSNYEPKFHTTHINSIDNLESYKKHLYMQESVMWTITLLNNNQKNHVTRLKSLISRISDAPSSERKDTRENVKNETMHDFCDFIQMNLFFFQNILMLEKDKSIISEYLDNLDNILIFNTSFIEDIEKTQNELHTIFIPMLNDMNVLKNVSDSKLYFEFIGNMFTKHSAFIQTLHDQYFEKIRNNIQQIVKAIEPKKSLPKSVYN